MTTTAEFISTIDGQFQDEMWVLRTLRDEQPSTSSIHGHLCASASRKSGGRSRSRAFSSVVEESQKSVAADDLLDPPRPRRSGSLPSFTPKRGGRGRRPRPQTAGALCADRRAGRMRAQHEFARSAERRHRQHDRRTRRAVPSFAAGPTFPRDPRTQTSPRRGQFYGCRRNFSPSVGATARRFDDALIATIRWHKFEDEDARLLSLSSSPARPTSCSSAGYRAAERFGTARLLTTTRCGQATKSSTA